jgi:glyoxylase-like metal-dependent hydrolase (beta-lactamase superfamily II)
VRIYRIRRYFTSVYLLEGEDRLALVDAGLWLGHAPAILRRIAALGRRPHELALLVVTHPHLDHFGGVAALRDVTQFDVVAHPDAAAAIAAGAKLVSPAVQQGARILETLAMISFPYLRFRGAGHVMPVVDGTSLRRWGVPGRILHTPGHSPCCISLLLDDGTAFVGDLALGKQAPWGRPAAPTMAVSLDQVVASWRKVLDAGATEILPAHGAPFAAAELADLVRRTAEA